MNSEESQFDKEMEAYKQGMTIDLVSAHALLNRAKDAGNEQAIAHARNGVSLGEDALAQLELARFHSVSSDMTKSLVDAAKGSNTGCRENIKKVRKALGENDL